MDQIGVPLWALQAYRGLVFIYVRVWRAGRLGAALALPPLPFPGSWHLPPPAISGQASSRPAEPGTAHSHVTQPDSGPGPGVPATPLWLRRARLSLPKAFESIVIQFASTSMYWASSLSQAAKRALAWRASPVGRGVWRAVLGIPSPASERS